MLNVINDKYGFVLFYFNLSDFAKFFPLFMCLMHLLVTLVEE